MANGKICILQIVTVNVFAYSEVILNKIYFRKHLIEQKNVKKVLYNYLFDCLVLDDSAKLCKIFDATRQ